MTGTRIKILIVDDLHPLFFENIGKQRFEIVYKPDIQADAVREALFDTDVLVVRSKVRVNSELCSGNPRLRLIARAGSGMDNLDTDWLEHSGIAFINTAGANRQAVAEHTLGMLLSLMSKICKSDQEVRNGIWDREGNRGDELSGKTVGIIGYGNTGSAFARTLSGFDVEVLAYDKYLTGFGTAQVTESGMEEIFNRADILSLHIPLTAETRYLVNEHYLNSFKKPIRLLNLSRGAIVQTRCVCHALQTGKLIGFGTDVLENEKLTNLSAAERADFEQLIKRSDVVLTPHTGGWSLQSYQNISKALALSLNQFFNENIPSKEGFEEAQKFP